MQQILCAVFGRIHQKNVAASNHLALWRGPSANARIQRAAGEVGIAFFSAYGFNAPFDANHALQLGPEKLQGSKRVARQFTALAAAVVAVPDDAARIKTLEQHHARTGAHVAAHGAQGHGVGLGHFGLQSFVKPACELLQGISVRGGFIQLGAFVTATQRSQFFGGQGHVGVCWQSVRKKQVGGNGPG